MGGGGVAYLVSKGELDELDPEEITGKTEIFKDPERNIKGINPEARVRLRRFHDNDNNQDLLIPEKRMYGNGSIQFQKQVSDWLKKAQKDTIDFYDGRPRMDDFVLTGGTYRDNTDADIFNDFFDDDLESGNTGHEDGGYEIIADQQREEIEDLERQWQRRFKHVHVNYEEMDDYNDDDGGVVFYWDATVMVDFPLEEFKGGSRSLDDIDDFLVGWRRNKEMTPLINWLSDNGFYASNNHIDHDITTTDLKIFISVDDENNNSGGPDDYNRFCNSIDNDWEDEYEKLVKCIREWFMDQGFMPLTPVRKYSGELQDEMWKNFDWNSNKNGELSVTASNAIGDSKHLFETGDDRDFNFAIDRTVKQVMLDAMMSDYNATKNQQYFRGMEPEEPHLHPMLFNLNYHMKNKVELVSRRALYTDEESFPAMLSVSFEYNDSASQETIDEFKHLITVADRVFPIMVRESARVFKEYERQHQAHIAAKQKSYWTNIQTPFEFKDPIKPKQYEDPRVKGTRPQGDTQPTSLSLDKP